MAYDDKDDKEDDYDGVEEESVVRKVKKKRSAKKTVTETKADSIPYEKQFIVYIMKFSDTTSETGIVDPFSMIRIREDLLLEDENLDAFSDVFRVKESDIKTLFKDMRSFFRGRATEDCLKNFYENSIRYKKDEVRVLEETYDNKFSKWYEEEDVV